jgi:hypothetical protein
MWHAGYWGPHVGYYGGVNYGFGYGGIGFAGGMWRGGFFAYNTAVVHVGGGGGWGNRTYVDNTIVERTTIINNTHVSYNGGPGGINHQPAPEERIAEHEQHTAPTSFQAQHENTFRNDHTAYAKVNGGHPQNVALSRPLAAENHPAPASFQNHVSPQPNAHPMGESVNHGNPPAPANERPAYRSQAAPPAAQVNHQPAYHSESAPHNGGGGNPHPNSAPPPRPAPHAESRPAPQPHPEEKREH